MQSLTHFYSLKNSTQNCSNEITILILIRHLKILNSRD